MSSHFIDHKMLSVMIALNVAVPNKAIIDEKRAKRTRKRKKKKKKKMMMMIKMMKTKKKAYLDSSGWDPKLSKYCSNIESRLR